MKKGNYKNFFSLDKLVRKIRSYLPSLSESRFREAFAFAEKAHRGQFRKDGVTPYIAHPVAAVEILTGLHADEDTLISCLLHDVPEDTKYEIHDVKEKFGDKVAFLVDGITKLSKVQYQQNMPERQVESLKKLLLHSAEDLRVVVIKLADRLHNMSTLGNITKEEKRIRIATETLEIYVPIANLLGLRSIKSQLEDYCFKYLFPSEYKKISDHLKNTLAHRRKYFEEFRKIVSTACKKEGVKVKIEEKTKNIYRIYKKICSTGKTIEDIDERIAVNVITADIPSCYRVLGIVHSKFLPKTDRFKDYIANPKSNGYQSLHTGVFGVDGILTEVQIKTEKMNIEAEYGIASHFFLDKDAEGFFAAGSDQSSWVNKILELEKNDADSDSFIEGLKSDIFKERIFAFTPKGEPVDLPQGATAIDFAYAIHSEIGDRALKAKINGKNRPISTILNMRDVVKIVCDDEVRPNLSWLSFAKTNLARNKILEYLKKVDRKSQIKAGQIVFQKHLDIAGQGLVRDISFKKLKARVHERLGLNFKSIDDLMMAIGRGDVKAYRVVELVNGASKRKPGTKVDERVVIKIVAKNRFGLLKDITDVLYRNVKDMYSFRGWAAKQDVNAYFSAEVLVDDINILNPVFAELEQIEDVIDVCRVSKKGVIAAYAAVMLTAVAWILHPLLLSYLSSLSTDVIPKVWSSALIYLSFLILLILLYWLQSILSRYFPLFRAKVQKVGWIVAFIIPVLGMTTLALEMISFDFQLSWSIFLIEVFMVYSYLLMSYRNYRKSMAYLEEEHVK